LNEETMIRSRFVVLAVGVSWMAALAGQDPAEPPRGPFGYSLIETAGGEPADIEDFFQSEACAMCHPRQWDELRGSMHSVAHHDPLYRGFAELAREEAGEEVYTLCSGCHSPAGVVTGLIPAYRDPELPEEAKAGVTCDVCHQVSELTGHDGPWGEPGNASFVLSPGRTKFGPIDEIKRNVGHEGKRAEHLSSSEFCASCHTIIHPFNGLRLEHTYDEWKKSIYAEKGIQCQDCHMRSVEDAVQVARTLEPVVERGAWARDGEEREIHRHYFVGGNANADALAGSTRHGRMAEERLRSAAELTVEAPPAVAAGDELAFDVVIANVAAGHNLPTSLVELREMWVHARVLHADGRVLFESGALDEAGEITDGAIRFGAHAVDADGNHTYKPWEVVAFDWKRTIPPKSSTRDTLSVRVPADVEGSLSVEVRLLYRSAAPSAVELAMGDEAFDLKIVTMAEAAAEVAVER
jgi:hypothetical protein